jgi:tRNA (cytidine/uridine-2'-O-)-methyltransferase
VFHLVFVEPRIPPNTGNAIRIAANSGAHLHLVEPLGFMMSDAQVRRAGLDYHEMAHVTVHPNLEVLWVEVLPANVYAFTASATTNYATIAYQPGDVLMFGSEPTGLDAAVLQDKHVTERVRIPMMPGVRSINLSNAASIVVYEAWRQQGFTGAADLDGQSGT